MSTDKGFFLTTHSPRNPLIVNLIAIGERVIRADDFRLLPVVNLQACQGYIGNLFSEVKKLPALIRLLRRLKHYHVPYIFWNRDAPWNVGITPFYIWVLRKLQPVDIYLCHSQQTAHLFSRVCHYFPNAALKNYYHATTLSDLRQESRYHYDISFIGSFGNLKKQGCKDRADFLMAVEQRVKQKIERLKVCFIDTFKERLSFEEQANIIRTSKININYGTICDLPENKSWGLTERVFGIPAAGGFLLTEYRKCILETFPGGICDYFENIEDCSVSIIYYLNNFKLLRDRAEHLHKHVIRNHTYEIRAMEFLKIVKKWHREMKNTNN